MGYPKERKEAALKKMMPPNNQPISQIAKTEGISEATLYAWRADARKSGRLLPDGDTTPEGWNASDKFAAVLETASLNDAELSAWCREKGLYPDVCQHSCRVFKLLLSLVFDHHRLGLNTLPSLAPSL
ncbi:transposase [Agaribacter flavus]|uniref:Transposase n=1 Tax=Agaribacter flavus TaxID=1902781 RepID=A0ABV7FLA7_9ALTE